MSSHGEVYEIGLKKINSVPVPEGGEMEGRDYPGSCCEPKLKCKWETEEMLWI
jgi:hypothetical protein